MVPELRIDELLLQWEERRDQGRAASPEDLCAADPDLLPELRKRIQALEAMDGMLCAGDPPNLPSTGDRQPVETAKIPAAAQKTFEEAFELPGYEILSELGRGGMGVVYKARQGQLNRLVALKTFLPGEEVRPEDLARFTLEAQAVARLQHPNIVQIHDVGDRDGRPYLSLELVEGGSLEQKMEQRRWLPEEAAQCVEILARAVHYAHTRDVIHRDLKPSNILFGPAAGSAPSLTTPFGVPKVVDFGLARCLDGSGPRLTKKGAVLGTPSYMAPEQAAGKSEAVTAATDVHALGVILYELLTGQAPYDAPSVYETLRAVIRQPPTPPRNFDPFIPAELETICLKCLEKEPAKRYASAEELADKIREFLAGPGARRGVLSRHLGKLAIIAALAIAAALFVVFRPRPDPDPKQIEGPGPVAPGPAPAITEDQIRHKAAGLRPLLLGRLGKARMPDGWILCRLAADAEAPRDVEVWGHSQALADLLLSKDLRTDDLTAWVKGLENPFAPGQAWEAGGVKYGWPAFPSADYPIAPPAIQTGLALTAGLEREGLLTGERRQRCLKDLRYTQEVLKVYRAEPFDGGWNMFPRQKDPAKHSASVTAMTLQFLLALRRAGLPWDGSDKTRDDLLTATIRWVDKTFEPSGDSPGWREAPGRPIGDGLTLMLYTLRLQADTDAGFPMPPEMLEQVPLHLLRCGDRQADYPSAPSMLLYPFVNHTGEEAKLQQVITIQWYRWSLAAAVAWLKHADHRIVPPFLVEKVNLVIGHLVVDIGKPVVDVSLTGWTFIAADNFNGLSLFPPP